MRLLPFSIYAVNGRVLVGDDEIPKVVIASARGITCSVVYNADVEVGIAVQEFIGDFSSHPNAVYRYRHYEYRHY